MKSPILLAACVAIAALTQSAIASACQLNKTSPSPFISEKGWLDVTEIGFRLGRDFYGTDGTSALIRRLDSFFSRDDLHKEFRQWRNRFEESKWMAGNIAQLDSMPATLIQLCKQVDDADFNETSLPENWTNTLNVVRQSIENISAPLPETTQRLSSLSSLLSSAASHYAQRGYPSNPQIRTGPPLSAVANTISTLHLRWRAIHSDLAFAKSRLSFKTDANPEVRINGLEVAANMLDKAVKDTAALIAGIPDKGNFNRMFTGEFIYDQCPVPEDTWIKLFSDWDKINGGILTISGALPPGIFPKVQENVILLNPNTKLPFFTEQNLRMLQEFRFTRHRNGWYGIESRAFPGSYLDILYLQSKMYPANVNKPASGVGLNLGQQWRCVPEGRKFRLSNRFLSEEKSLDVYSNVAKTYSGSTGGYYGQYWSIKQ